MVFLNASLYGGIFVNFLKFQILRKQKQKCQDVMSSVALSVVGSCDVLIQPAGVDVAVVVMIVWHVLRSQSDRHVFLLYYPI